MPFIHHANGKLEFRWLASCESEVACNMVRWDVESGGKILERLMMNITAMYRYIWKALRIDDARHPWLPDM